ncbi:MAG TPA: hypothetical protein VIO58_12540 [Candidatus Methanoperedens sp.]
MAERKIDMLEVSAFPKPAESSCPGRPGLPRVQGGFWIIFGYMRSVQDFKTSVQFICDLNYFFDRAHV